MVCPNLVYVFGVGRDFLGKTEVFTATQGRAGGEIQENGIFDMQTRQQGCVIGFHQPVAQHGEEIDKDVNCGSGKAAAGEHDAKDRQTEEEQEHGGGCQQPHRSDEPK